MTNAEFSENNLIAQLNKDVEKINTPELSKEKRALLLSELLTDQYLQAETIKMLEEITPKSQNLALWINLGKLYQSVGSNDLAEKTYIKATKLANNAQKPIEQILAKAGLADVLTSQGKKQKAERLLEEIKTEIDALKSETQQTRTASSTCTQPGPCGSCFEDGMTGKCVRVHGTPWIICQPLDC